MLTATYRLRFGLFFFFFFKFSLNATKEIPELLPVQPWASIISQKTVPLPLFPISLEIEEKTKMCLWAVFK